jgi:hypothetical protein
MKKQKIEKENDVIWPIRMKKSFKNKFKIHCDKNGYSMNKRIKILIEKDINEENNEKQ